MPDAELFSLAEKGALHDRAELSRQVARMLKDERAARFTDSFATQWLRLRKVGTVSYTHLDVYKRQGEGKGKSGAQGRDETAKGTAARVMFRSGVSA